MKQQQTMGLKTREFLRSNHKQIVHAWNYRLKEYPPFQDPIKFSTIQKEQEKGKDLFSTVLELDPGPGKDLQEGTWSIVNRIHSPAYSVCDFAIEAFCLEDAVCHALMNTHFPPEQLFAANQEIRRTVFTLSQTILERSAGIYEYAVENGKRAFCYFDCHGDIRYSNEAMLSLTKTTGQVSKTNITQFFAPADKTLIEEMLRDTLGRKTIFRSLNFKDGQGRVLPVGAEISPIIIQGKPVGGYAGLVDLSRVMQGQEKVYDKSALGIIKVNTNYEFTYANPAAQDILGEKNLEGKSIKHLFPKKKSWQTVKQQLKTRFKNGLADEYEVEISTLGKISRTVPVRISGIPETDLKGEITGSLAIVHSLELEKAGNAIHEKIDTFQDVSSFFEDIGRIVAGLVPFREMIVSTFSADLKHVRGLSWGPDLQPIDPGWQGVWWAIPRHLEEWLFSDKEAYIDDIEAFVNQPGRVQMKNDPAVSSFLQKGLMSMVRCPIFREKKLIASIAFFRKKKDGFSKKEIAVIEKLPLRKAILALRYKEEKNTLEFRLDLMSKIFDVCHDLDQVGQTIVENLVDHYKWQNASFFTADTANKLFRLKGQKSLGDRQKYLLPDKYTQPLKDGILGYVYTHKKTLNISNIQTDKKFKKYFIEKYEGTRSELCIPIIVEGRVCWLLNLEDARENAFCRDEINSLKLIISEVGEILRRAHAYYIHEITLASTSDAVITTDFTGKISTANPAAERLLDLEFKDLKGKSLRRYFKDKKLFDRLKSGREAIQGKEAYIQGAGKKNNYVLLSSSPLPEESGGRVFFAKDLSLLKRVRELEYLDQMTYEVALQTKTPLSLLFSWLGRIESVLPEDRQELMDKITRQLKKIELTTDRLALFESGKGIIPYNEARFDFSDVIHAIKKDFPKSEIDRINFKNDHTPSFKGDRFQIKFCVETILSYLLRYLPGDRKIDVMITHNTEWIQCRIKGVLPGSGEDGIAEEKAAMRQTLDDMALGEPIIDQFIRKNHKGKYIRPKGRTGQFRIDLPTRKTGHE